MDTILQLCNNPILDTIGKFIKGGSQTERKHILLLARHQGLPQGNGNMYQITISTIDSLIALFLSEHQVPLRDRHTYDTTIFQTQINITLSHPLYSGAIIMMCCIAPMDEEDQRRIMEEAFFKEVDTMDTSPYFPGLDFSCFFGDYSKPLHPRMQPNPTSAKVVHDAIKSWIHRHTQETRIHRPTLSKKLLPKFTRDDLDLWISTEVAEPGLATQGALEYLWMKYEVMVDGPCEIKQRWYTNGMTPRTYFVCGPTLFEKSKYTKDLWNDLVDSLVITQRHNRVNPRRIHIEGIERALFYDLSTFTSNCAAQREFLSYLARVVEGLPFCLLDTRYGPQIVDFGDIVREYCQTNAQPGYANANKSYSGVHGVAGFLGVYGNIATCTFLHGAFLMQLASNDRKCGCAGDDAVIVTVEEDSSIWICVELIGVIAREKTFASDDPDVIYLKRRTWRDEAFCRLDFSTYIQLPSFLFNMHPQELARYRESALTKAEMKELAYSSLSAFFKSAVAFRNTSAFPDIVNFARSYYTLLRIPWTGHVPQFSYGRRYGDRFIPHLAYLGERDFITGTLETTYPGWCMLPSRPHCEHPVEMKLREDDVVILLKGPDCSLLARMGVLEPVASAKKMWYDSEGLEKLLAEYSGHGENVDFARFRVVKDITDVPCPPVVFGERDETFLLLESITENVDHVQGMSGSWSTRGTSYPNPHVHRDGIRRIF